MSTDNELLDEVRALLREEVADVTAGPELLAAVRRARARRSVRRRLLLAVPVAAAVAVVATSVLTTTPPPARESPPQADPVNAAYVKEKTSAALDGVLDNVIYEHAIVTEGDKYSKPGEAALYERWLAADGSTFRLRVTIDGRPVVDLSRDHVADVLVQYGDRTYRAFPGTEPSAPEHDDVWTPKEIQDAITNGRIEVVGPGEPVNGKETVRLRTVAGKAEVPIDLWVDATSYLPVRWQFRQDGATLFDVSWLPPTPENLNQLKTTVPPGFTEQK